MIVDSHIHTGFSTDSDMSFAQAVQQAEQQGIGITITEHMDMNYPETGQFVFDVDQYFIDYGASRSDTVLLGIELGMQMSVLEDNRRLAAQYPFDFVLGSIHLVDGIDIYGPQFYEPRSKDEAYGRYFDTMAECLHSYNFIDSLGHIDYIARYARYDDPEIRYTEFTEQIDRVLSLAASQGKAMEINTRRLTDDVAAALMPIYRRFYDLGGRLVTIGSDSHHPEDVGKSLKQALALAESCRLRPVYFCRREPQYLTGV